MVVVGAPAAGLVCGQVGKLMVQRLHSPLHLLSGPVLCNRPVLFAAAAVAVMPSCLRICPCLRRTKVSPAEDGSRSGTKSLPRSDSIVSALELPTLEGVVTRYTFGSFELCTRDLEAVTPDSPSATDLSSKTDITAGNDVTTANGVIAKDRRPLVIMFPWLNARQSTVYKYGSLYLQRGMDVLTMKVTPMQIIRPMQTKKIVGELLDLLQDKNGPLADRPIIIHGFSIGAFVYGQLLVEMDRKKQSNTDLDQLVANPGSTTTDDAAGSASDAKAETLVEHPSNAITFRTDDEWTTVDLGPSRERSGSDVSRDNSIGKDRRVMGQITQEGANNNRRKSSVESLTGSSGSTSTDIRSRIVGIVMDSPTPFENILEGIPNSISDNSFIKASIRTLFSTYMRAFHRSVTVHYIQGAHAAESNQAGHPTLMLYSSADNIVSSAKLDEVVADWKKRGHFVRCRKWEDTPHVGHFRLHPNEYTKEVQEFIEHLRLTEAKL